MTNLKQLRREHDLVLRIDGDVLVADRRPRGGLLVQIGTERSAGLEWNFVRLSKSNADRLRELLWTSSETFTAEEPRLIAQTVIAGFLMGEPRWAEDARTGQLLYGMDAKGRAMQEAPAVPHAKRDIRVAKVRR